MKMIDSFKKIISSIDTFLAGVTLVIMTVVTFANVVSRYLLHASLSFTDEMTTNLFVLGALAGASIAARNGKHLGLSILTDVLPRKIADVFEIAGNLIGAIFAFLCAYLGTQAAGQQFARNQLSPALRIPEGVYMSFLVIGMLLIGISFLLRAIEYIKNEKEETT